MSYLGDHEIASAQSGINMITKFDSLNVKTNSFYTQYSTQDTTMKNIDINQGDFNNTLKGLNDGLDQDQTEYDNYLDWYNNVWKPAHNF